ncbi:MAG: steroid 5-alpha reductase family enzyme [Pseudohongiellaceae bacterium]|jgi:steroid 5-alpha reductase family enzyme
MIKPLIGILVILIISCTIALAGAQGSIEANGLPLFLICASVGFILHWVLFVPSFIAQTEHYFDLTGSMSYVSTIIVAYLFHPNMDARSLVVCALIAIWAIRLGSFLFLRVKKDGKDRRFDEVKTKFFRYMFTWTLGGAWVFITMAAGLAVITSSNQVALDGFFYAGVALWVLGFGIEVIADRQKAKFRRISENKGKFITEGLWSISRHPNYFGEIVLWLGIAVVALPTLVGWQYVTLISPIFVAFLLIKVSGVKLLEISGMERWGDDPAYINYVASTPSLVPFSGGSKNTQ